MNRKILELVNNRDFQNLTDYYGKRTIFETLKVERKENRPVQTLLMKEDMKFCNTRQESTSARKHVPNGTFISMPTNCFLSKVEAKGLCA